MNRNNFVRFNPRQYEEHLSPFGRKVLGTLIKHWSAERAPSRERNINASLQHRPPPRYNNSHGRVLTFGESTQVPSTPINSNLCNPANQPGEFYDDDSSFELPTTENTLRSAPPTDTMMLLPPPPEFLAPPPVPVQSKVSTPAPISAPSAIPGPVAQRVPLPVLTSTQLVTAVKDNDQVNFSNDDLIGTIDKNADDSRDIFGTIEEGTNVYKEMDDAIDKARNVLKECRSANNINWDDMFDSELFQDVDLKINQAVETANEPSINDKVFDIRFPDNTSNSNITRTNTNKRSKQGDTDTKRSKRKNQTKVTETIPKKVKKIQNEVKNKSKALPSSVYRNDKINDPVTNWLNGVNPNHPVEEFRAPLEDAAIKPIKDKLDNLIETNPPTKTKKVIQAQLANKGGIMKFGNPKKNITENSTNTISATSECDSKDKSQTTKETNEGGVVKFGKPKKNSKDETRSETTASESDNKDKRQIVKEKKPKSKFVAPIKSQIPVKDVTYEIIELNETNARKSKLDTFCDQEIIAVLLYSNGFCQLNNQHTDDSCIPEAVMFNLEDHFFILKDGDVVARVLSQMLRNNAMICYDGKALLIYLISKLKLDLDITYTFKIIDVKIGGSLLEPDSPPDTFSALQRLTGSEPEYTIATTCNRQKAAWYATQLSTTAAAVRTKLEQEDLWQVFVDIEMSILPIIADMEQRGVCVDMDKLKEMEKILVAKMKGVESECTAAAGRSFQINSTVQVRALLYDELKLDEKAGLKVRGTLTTGAKSTSETMLKSLVSLHPLPRLILEYRHLHKAHATFLQGVAQYVRGGVVRPVWVQTAAATGRIASSNPNLQAIPKVPFSLRLFPENGGDNSEELLRFRSVYVSRPNCVILAADWRHVECRVFARAAADTSLQKALEAPDLFRRLAADWLQRHEDEISSEDRERTKRIVYASLYGAGPRKLMDILDVDYSQALSIAASFDRTFPSLRSFGRRVAAQCLASGGRVATLCGRARTLPHIASADAAQRSHAERQALNFIVQGSAADVCKLAMGDAVRALQTKGLRARLLLQIHDELVWEVEHQDLAEAADVIRSAMEQCGSPAGLPSLPVALSVGRSWGELQPYPSQTLDSDSQSFEI